MLMPFIVGFRLLAVRLFSYNSSFSYLSLRDCKTTTLCYNKGLEHDKKKDGLLTLL